MKSIAIVGLALAGSAAAKSIYRVPTNHVESSYDDEFALAPQKPQPQRPSYPWLINYGDDEADNELMGASASRNMPVNNPTPSPVYLIVQQQAPQKPQPEQRMWLTLPRSLDDEADNELARIPQNKGPVQVAGAPMGGAHIRPMGGASIRPMGGAPARKSENEPTVQPIYVVVQQQQPQPEPKKKPERMWWSFSRTLDDEADNELVMADDDEFAVSTSNSKKVKQDEIDTLASLIKDGKKVGGSSKQETKKTEGPKGKKFLGL